MVTNLSQTWNYKQDGIPKRQVMTFVAFIGYTYLFMLRVNVNIVVVAMVNYTAIPHTNITVAEQCGRQDHQQHSYHPLSEEEDGEFVWNEQIQSLVSSSFFWGFIMTPLVGGILAERYGTKYLFAGATALAALVTVCLPPLARAGSPYFMLGRASIGFVQGVCSPSMHSLLSKWAPPEERSSMAAFIYAGSQMGTIVGLSLSGIIVDAWGWEAVFYIQGPMALIFLLMWMLLVYDSPDQHPRISAKERTFIRSVIGRSNTSQQQKMAVPWRSIASSAPVWALVISNVCNSWGFYMLLTELPIYMKTILHFDTKSNAILSSLPHLVMWIFSLLIAQIADWLSRHQLVSVTTIRKTANTISHAGPAVCLIIVSFVGCNSILTMALLTLAVGLQGAIYSGFMVNHLDIAPNFAGIIFGITTLFSAVPSWLAPLTVATLTKGQQTLGQWRIAFLLTAAILIAESIVFLLFASGQQQPWNEPSSTSTSTPVLPAANDGTIKSKQYPNQLTHL